MDIAEIIFRIGVGIGALLIGISLLALVLAIGPLSNDARSLAADMRRLVRLIEAEVPHLRDRAPRTGREAPPPGRPEVGPVQSAEQREDEQIA